MTEGFPLYFFELALCIDHERTLEWGISQTHEFNGIVRIETHPSRLFRFKIIIHHRVYSEREFSNVLESIRKVISRNIDNKKKTKSCYSTKPNLLFNCKVALVSQLRHSHALHSDWNNIFICLIRMIHIRERAEPFANESGANSDCCISCKWMTNSFTVNLSYFLAWICLVVTNNYAIN